VNGVDHAELDLAPDGHSAVAAALLRVDAQHGLRSRLKNKKKKLGFNQTFVPGNSYSRPLVRDNFSEIKGNYVFGRRW